MIKKLFLLSLLTAFFSCSQKQTVDTIVINAKVYTVDKNFSNAEAFAVKDGKFVGVGNTSDILTKYEAKTTIDVNGKTVLPGLIDAHCHFYRLGTDKQSVDLVGTESFEEVIQRIFDFQKEKNVPFITGRGWDQNDWEVKEFPTKDRLDKLFPNTPIALTRVDGHAYLVNQKALEFLAVKYNSKTENSPEF